MKDNARKIVSANLKNSLVSTSQKTKGSSKIISMPTPNKQTCKTL